MNILDQIIIRKKEEIAVAKTKVSMEELTAYPLYNRVCYRLRDFVLAPDKTGIIAEYKRASPSKGIINDRSAVEEVVKGYADAHVSAISVLTDHDFFKGSLADLEEARAVATVPLLRKDFIIDEYQIAEAKAYGADIILLIAAVLTNDEVLRLAKYAKALGLNVLLEIHNEEELENNTIDEIDAIGVNNRNLKDFTVSIENSLGLVDRIPDRYVKISESGISNPQLIQQLKHVGFHGFLIGENFMKTANPVLAIQQFTRELNK
ncbi:indole-3-glycerol phosphate synthase TrpC [Olivibacter ginsenosidimutans]|uniref:indole-3-glycerol-phosphate synthase n=1 Tax=Olivibacter ginsenosidimutans TaxID=1176537 RepID=A0ABP9APQ8_9SPHI